MNRESATEFLSGLPREEKALFLARLALELSIAARSTYTLGSDQVDNPRALRAFNELQHSVLGNEVGLLNGAPCYPDDLLVQMIFSNEDLDIQPESSNAFCRTADKMAHCTTTF